MSSGISALCRACPRLASQHARQAAARSIASHPKPRPTIRPALNRIASPRSYASAEATKREARDPQSTARERNKNIKWTYKNTDPERREKELHSAFVSSPREYPSEDMTALSEKERMREAHKMAGAHEIWAKSLHPKHFLVDRLDWTDTRDNLKALTPRTIDDDNRVSAMRVVLSESLIESETLGKGVSFVNSVTGIMDKMRVDADAKAPNEAKRRSFILRGGRRVLSQAVDELSKTHEGVEVFELGDVATTDYHTQRLWPTKDVLSEEELKSYNRSTRDRIWLHEELGPQWLTRKLSSIPKPEKGNPQAFESYITELVRVKIKSEHVLPLYFKGYGKHYKNIDVGAERVQLIMDAFENPEYHSSITSTSLKRALNQLARVDGHRGKAKRLFRLAEDLGLPMDTENYNIMLEGIATTGDYRDFHKWVTKMKACEFEPNARTWLIFLRLVKKDNVRQQIVSSMFERNLLAHQSVRRGVAAVMASTDAHQSFKSGSSLKQFIKEHNTRFGYMWYTSDALFGILREYFRYFRHENVSVSDWSFLVEQRFEDGKRMDTESMNTLVELCSQNSDWVGAIWCVNFMQTHGIEFDDKTIELLMRLACDTGNRHAFTAAVFHGVHHRAINRSARPIINFALLSTQDTNPWRNTRLPMFTPSMADAMRIRNKSSKDHLADQITDVYKQASNELKLVPAEPLAMSLMSALSLHHKASELRGGANTATVPALEIPMKLVGDSDDDVKETFKFDSTVALLQENGPSLEPANTEEPTSSDSALENSEDQDADLVDTALAAEEDTTTPKKQKPRNFQPQFSLFSKGLNTTIPKAPTKPAKRTPSSYRSLSPEEQQMLASIRDTTSPRPGNEALRLARDEEDEIRRKVNFKTTARKPWLFDDFYEKDEATQREESAEWLFKRYREIKSRDRRNVDFTSRARLMIRAQKELAELERQGEDIDELLGKNAVEEVERGDIYEEEEGDVEEKKQDEDYDPTKWGYYQDDKPPGRK